MPLWYSYMRLDDGGPIKGEAFRHFLDICWPYTDYITLSEGMFEDAPDVEFMCLRTYWLRGFPGVLLRMSGLDMGRAVQRCAYIAIKPLTV